MCNYFTDEFGIVRIKRTLLQKLIHKLKYNFIYHVKLGIRSGIPLCCIIEWTFSSDRHRILNMPSFGCGYCLCKKCQNEFILSSGLVPKEMQLID